MDKFSDSMKKVLLAGIGAVAVTAEKSKDILDEMVKKGELTVEQGKVLNEELKHTVKNTVKKEEEEKDFGKILDNLSSEDMAKLREEILKRETAGKAEESQEDTSAEEDK